MSISASVRLDGPATFSDTHDAMKTSIVFSILALAVTCQAQNITRVTTLLASSIQTNSVGQPAHGGKTNSIAIPAGEAARISTQKYWTALDHELNFAQTGWIQRGVWFDAANGDVVEGPVTFVIELSAVSESYCRMTLERWKVSKK